MLGRFVRTFHWDGSISIIIFFLVQKQSKAKKTINMPNMNVNHDSGCIQSVSGYDVTNCKGWCFFRCPDSEGKTWCIMCGKAGATNTDTNTESIDIPGTTFEERKSEISPNWLQNLLTFLPSILQSRLQNWSTFFKLSVLLLTIKWSLLLSVPTILVTVSVVQTVCPRPILQTVTPVILIPLM